MPAGSKTVCTSCKALIDDMLRERPVCWLNEWLDPSEEHSYAFARNPTDLYLVVGPWEQIDLLIRRTFMTPWVHRVSYPSTVLQYIGDLFLTLLIAAGGIMLVLLAILLFV